MRKTGNVHQVVDQVEHLLCLSADDIANPFLIGIRRTKPHDLDRVANGSQGVPQFVSKHPQEFILVLNSVLKFLRPPR